MLRNLVQSFARTPILTKINQIYKPLNFPLTQIYKPTNFSLAATIGLHYQVNRYRSLYGAQLATKKFWIGKESVAKGSIKKKCLFTRNRTAERSWKKRAFGQSMRYKMNGHKGLLMRIKLYGPRWDRKFKFKSASHNHL